MFWTWLDKMIEGSLLARVAAWVIVPAISYGLFFLGCWAVLSAYQAIVLRLFPERSRIARVKAQAALASLWARQRRMMKPTLLLTPASVPGFSKIGGAPDLPAEVAWPVGERGLRVFVAQIDLAAFQMHSVFDWLPSEGRLWFFFDPEKNGFADSVCVVASKLPPTPQASRERVNNGSCFAERRIAFMRFNSVPSADWLDVDQRVFAAAGDVEMRSFEDCDLGDEIQHRIGGYPEEIQGGAMAIDCEYMRRGQTRNYGEEVPEAILRASKAWRLLLQVDSDPAIGMNWWDGGRLYVFVREKDAARADFSKTVTITQTH